jgi:hypothetical protein
LVLRLVLSLLTLSLLCVSVPGFAQEQNQELAVQLAQEGGEAFQQGDYVLAAQKFGDAYTHYQDTSLKLNEMAAWYKARRCGEAISVANQITGTPTHVADLTDTDRKDLKKVHRDCGYDEAEKMLDDGDLDGAETRLAGIRPLDPELASSVGELRGKIAERRKVLAEQNNTQADPDVSAKADPAPAPAPSWAKLAGLGGIGLGGAVVLYGVGKFLFVDQPSVGQWRTYFEDNHGCTLARDNTLDLDSCSSRMTAEGEYNTFVDELRRAQRANTILYAVGGSVAVVGAGLYGYYLFRKMKYDAYQAEHGEAALTPVITPNYAGVSLQLRF